MHPDQKLQRNNHVNPFEISNTVIKSQLLSYAKSVSVENIIHPSDLLEKLDLFCLKLMNSKLEFIYVLRTVDHQKVYSFTKNALNEYSTSEMRSLRQKI